jgi:soluble epoxide hydrolase / lipid-phosphate phosphatase
VLTAELLPYFDHFISSSEIGLRKPNPEIFKLALERIGCRADEVVFLDDIGNNLKAASKLGIRCVRVRIGKEGEAVRELEKMMEMKLSDQKAKL